MGKSDKEVWMSYCQRLQGNLPNSDYVLMCWVAGHPNASTSEIADGVSWNYGNVASSLSDLVSRGWLERPSRGHYRVAGT